MMNKFSTFIALLFLLSLNLNAQTYGWANSIGGNGWDDVKSSCLDANNNTINVGMFSNTANFGSISLTSLAYQDGFVAKYDSTGSVVWANAINGANEQDWAYDVTTDNQNNVYVVGYFQSTSIKFTATDSLIKSSLSSRNGFLAKYNSSGVFQWARLASGGTTAAFITTYSVATDVNNNVIISGSYNKTVNFNGTALPNTNASNIFMAKYNTSGNLVWAKAGVSSAQCWFQDMACDNNGNIYATGKFSKQITFGTLASPQVSGDQLIVARFDSMGVPIWYAQQGDSLSASTSINNFDCGSAIKVNANATAIYVAGSILDTFYFDANLNMLVIKQFAMISKYNNSGILQWTKTFGNEEGNKINAIDLDAQEDIYAIGEYKNNFTLGNITLPADTLQKGFVAKFESATGNPVFAYQNGLSIYTSMGIGIGVNQQSGQVYTTGNYKDNISFNNALNSMGVWDIYMSRLNNNIGPSSILSIKNNNIILFPNPANDKLYMDGIESNNTLINIFNSNGQLVLSEKYDRLPINIAHLPSANYSISIKEINKTTVLKFSKK